ncbi:MAG: hypothetical protein RIR79_545 [Pseudomonadota bacterium]|jgi:twitching motility protein PilJ
MSIVDKIKNAFRKKQPESELDSRLSLATPDDSSNLMDETLHAGGGSDNLLIGEHEENKSTADDLIHIPILGERSVAQQQRLLFALLAGALVILGSITAYALYQSEKLAKQLGTASEVLIQSQRLAKSVSQAVIGNPQAFQDVMESQGLVVTAARGLRDGNDSVKSLDGDLLTALEKVLPLVDRAEAHAKIVLDQKAILTQINTSLRFINRYSSDMLEVSEAVLAMKLQRNAAIPEVSAVGQLVMLTQRIGKSSNEFITTEGVSPEAAFLLGKDLNSFKEIAVGLLSGNPEFHLAPAQDQAMVDQLNNLLNLYEKTRVQAGSILGNINGLVSARKSQDVIIADSEPLRFDFQAIQRQLEDSSGIGGLTLLALVVMSLFALTCAGGLSYIQVLDSRRRQMLAETQRMAAERQEREAKRINDANQAAILRLMNELQTVAEGDLTQEATVTEDITGAIADSVNYTVEELRSLVSNVQNTATRVAQTTADVDATSTELLAASNEQLHEIRETGRSVVDMAARINNVSLQAQESAAVARQSLEAAESGLRAVQDAIGGMNSIRDQIQDTSKRIKRLGESSQEIGEITELISDITEQTNVLALNAAIQAASAGEAGRGFSVVAEEVQRLAERSADATRQIAALVKAIQTDTQDAIGAMERSTQGVVEGARLSDNAGTALTDIDRVSRKVSDLIEQISNAASREAGLANVVAENIQHIFAVTEQTGEGTRLTASQVRELSRMAEELRQSVARFKII